MERQEDKPVPPSTLLDLFQGFFHRQDSLLGYMAETNRQILQLLRVISGAPAPGVPATKVEVTAISQISIQNMLDQLFKTPLPVHAYPLGRIHRFNDTAFISTTSFAEVTSYTPTSGKEFQLANLSISGDQDLLVKLVWGTDDLTPTWYVMAKLPFVQWFPALYCDVAGKALLGDGKTKLSLQACYPSGGSATTYCWGELVGDEL